VRASGVEVVCEGIDAGLQFFDCIGRVVDGGERVTLGRLGALDASVWTLGREDAAFEAWQSSSQTDLNCHPPSTCPPEILNGAVATISSRRACGPAG
jgi:hypothetical protein